MARSFIIAAGVLANVVFATQAGAWHIPSKADAPSAHTAHVHQAQFPLRASKGKIRRAMREAGYSEIKITHRGLTKTLAEGCKDGRRYRVELRMSGRIRNEQKNR